MTIQPLLKINNQAVISFSLPIYHDDRLRCSVGSSCMK
jgi:hypothetical protein